MKAWLYPISKRSGYCFKDSNGKRTPDTSYESFRDYVLTGKIKDTTWYATNNIHRVRKGDAFYVYTGDSDRGLIAAGKVVGVDEGKKWVEFEFHEKKSWALIAHPVPAQQVRPLIPLPRTGLVDITRAMHRLAPLLPWHPAYREREEALLKRLKLRPIRSVPLKNATGKRLQWLRHDSISGPIRLLLTARRYTVGTRSFGQLRLDMVAECAGHAVVVEGKSIVARKGRNEAREGLGQLLEYGWRLGRLRNAPKRITNWLAFSAAPDREVAEFLVDKKVVVSWPVSTGLKILNQQLIPT